MKNKALIEPKEKNSASLISIYQVLIQVSNKKLTELHCYHGLVSFQVLKFRLTS